MYRARVPCSADPKGYYASLGVGSSATLDQIRAAYHRCAKQCHPEKDPSPSAKARFQALSEAYRTLSNPSQRAAYDLRDARVVGGHRTGLHAVPWNLTELRPRSRAGAIRARGLFVGVGAFGLALAGLVYEIAAVSHDAEPVLVPSSPSASSSALRPVAQSSLAEATSASPEVGRVPAPPAAPKHISVQSGNLLVGTFLLRALPKPSSSFNLLAREEVVGLQELLLARAYLIGYGVWGPRSHAAFEDFQRIQKGGSDESSTIEKEAKLIAEPPPNTVQGKDSGSGRRSTATATQSLHGVGGQGDKSGEQA